MAKYPMNFLREKLAQPVYLVAIAAATAGWMWMLFQGLEWVLGV
jgi:hypothetical protein